jgi:hypothetical protein
VEFPLADYSSKAVGSSGQSFASKDGIKWEDLTKEFKPKTNACLKAFTAN